MTKLKITVGDLEPLADRTRDRLEAIEAGTDAEGLEATQPELRFSSLGELSELLSETRLELLRVIATRNPESITATAELVDRDYRAVHRDLSELAELGVIEWADAGPGGAKRPIFPYDGLAIDLDLAGEDSTDPARV